MARSAEHLVVGAHTLCIQGTSEVPNTVLRNGQGILWKRIEHCELIAEIFLMQ